MKVYIVFRQDVDHSIAVIESSKARAERLLEQDDMCCMQEWEVK
jgi:hypothetical protein